MIWVTLLRKTLKKKNSLGPVSCWAVNLFSPTSLREWPKRHRSAGGAVWGACRMNVLGEEWVLPLLQRPTCLLVLWDQPYFWFGIQKWVWGFLTWMLVISLWRPGVAMGLQVALEPQRYSFPSVAFFLLYFCCSPDWGPFSPGWIFVTYLLWFLKTIKNHTILHL